MRNLTLDEVILAMTGDIVPHGDSDTDSINLKNLDELCEALYHLFGKVVEVARLSESHEGSVSTAGQRARVWIGDYREVLREVEDE